MQSNTILAHKAEAAAQKTAQLVQVADITLAQKERMFELLDAHYDNVTYPAFLHDLAEKTWAILLARRSDGRIVGFSTQLLMEARVDGSDVMAVFSGDTIIDKNHWGGIELPVTWCRMMRDIRTQCPNKELYWFLISKGYKTYRFLPVYFREFYPSFRKPTPAFEARLMEHLAWRKFGDAYDPLSGVIRFGPRVPRLKRGVAKVTPNRLRNRDVKFFVRANPGHARGEELVCLAQFDDGNLKPFMARAIRKHDRILPAVAAQFAHVQAEEGLVA